MIWEYLCFLYFSFPFKYIRFQLYYLWFVSVYFSLQGIILSCDMLKLFLEDSLFFFKKFNLNTMIYN